MTDWVSNNMDPRDAISSASKNQHLELANNLLFFDCNIVSLRAIFSRRVELRLWPGRPIFSNQEFKLTALDGCHPRFGLIISRNFFFTCVVAGWWNFWGISCKDAISLFSPHMFCFLCPSWLVYVKLSQENPILNDKVWSEDLLLQVPASLDLFTA